MDVEESEVAQTGLTVSSKDEQKGDKEDLNNNFVLARESNANADNAQKEIVDDREEEEDEEEDKEGERDKEESAANNQIKSKSKNFSKLVKTPIKKRPLRSYSPYYQPLLSSVFLGANRAK